MIAFVTIGSTHFDPLVRSVLSPSVLHSLHSIGYSKLIVQCGDSKLDTEALLDAVPEDVNVEVWRYKPSLQADYQRADLVISHAGTGTILEVLRLGKPLIVVPNPTLMDNHQEEIAFALRSRGHLKATTLENLPSTIRTLDVSQLVPFPPVDTSRFRVFLDEEMGFFE